MAKYDPIVIEKPYGGFSSDYQSSTHAVEGRERQYTRSNGISFFRNAKYGHIAPGNVFDSAVSDSTPYINSVLRAGVVNVASTNPDVYYISGGLAATAPKVVTVNGTTRVASAGQAITAHGTHNFDSTPAGTKYFGEDVILYRHKVSGSYVSSLLYSWNDATDGDVGRYDLTSAYDDDFMSTVPASGAVLTGNVPHYMVEHKDRILYITNGQYLASYDGNTGTNGTFNAQALNLGQGWIGVGIRRFGNYLAILSIKSASAAFVQFGFQSESRVYLWRGFAPDPEFVYDVPDSFASGMAVADTIYVWTKGLNNTVKLWGFTGQQVSPFGKDPLFEQPLSLAGGTPQQNQIAYSRGMFWWTAGDPASGYSSNVCAYGPLGSSERGFHIPGILHDGTNTATEVGFLSNIEQNLLYAGVKYSTTYKLAYMVPDGNYMTSTDLRTRLYALPYKATLKRITVYFSQFGTGASLLLSLFRDYTTISVGGAADQLNKTITATTHPEVTTDLAVTFPANITDVSSFYMNLRFNHSLITNTAAIVRAIVVEWEPSDKG